MSYRLHLFLTLLMLFLLSAMLIETLFYGITAFSSIPHIDDWYFASIMFDYVAGKRDLLYVFDVHNGHPAFISHILVLISYFALNFNLSLLRWATTGLLFLIGALFSLVIYFDLRNIRNEAEFHSIFLVIPIFLIIGSKTAWELMSVATGINSVFCILAVALSLILMDIWIEKKQVFALITSFLAAFLASISFGTGFVVWFCLGIQTMIDPRVKLSQKVVLSSVLFTALFCSFALLSAASDVSSLRISRFTDFLTAMSYIPFVAGNAISPQIGNRPWVTVHFVLGLVILVASLGALAWGLVGGQRRFTAKYVAYVLFGLSNVLAISLTRFGLGLEGVCASRYAVPLMPVALGTCGILALMSYGKTNRLLPFVAYVAAIAPPLMIASIEEHRMAPYREASNAAAVGVLKETDGKDIDLLKRTFYVDDQYVNLIISVRDYMKIHHLSVFSQQ
jgi:hypothetical protein